jgi:hypothetical protein
MKVLRQIDPITDKAARIDMIPESIDSWQSRRSSKRGDPFCVVEKQSVDEHDDRLDMVICQCLKCRIEVIR